MPASTLDTVPSSRTLSITVTSPVGSTAVAGKMGLGVEAGTMSWSAFGNFFT